MSVHDYSESKKTRIFTFPDCTADPSLLFSAKPRFPPDIKVHPALKNVIKTSIYIFPSGQVVGGAQGTEIHTGEGFASSMENKGPPATTYVA